MNGFRKIGETEGPAVGAPRPGLERLEERVGGLFRRADDGAARVEAREDFGEANPFPKRP